MTEEEKKLKQQHDDKMRCAHFLLQMIEKYGAEVKAEHEKKTAEKE